MPWQCKRCSYEPLDAKAPICPNCGLADPAIEVKGFRELIIKVIPLIVTIFVMYGLLHLNKITNIYAVIFIYVLLLGTAFSGIISAYLFIFNWQRQGMRFLRVTTYLAFFSAFLILVL
jgi:hypothetical protein